MTLDPGGGRIQSTTQICTTDNVDTDEYELNMIEYGIASTKCGIINRGCEDNYINVYYYFDILLCYYCDILTSE